MKTVAIYARKSVYREGSLSVENQITFCKEYMNKKYNDANYMIFEDEGFSGGNTNRPEFIRLMKLIKLGKIDVVVCYKVDRIARNIVDFVNIYDEFSKNKVELISITEGFDPSTPIGKMLMLFLASFAEMERMNIQQRVRDNKLALAKMGRWGGGGIPIGYKLGNKNIEIDTPEPIQEIFSMKADRKGLTEIMDYINAKYDNMISSKDVLGRILRKAVYAKSSDLVNSYLRSKYDVVGNPDGIHSYLRYNDKESKTFYMCVAENVEGIVDSKTWLIVQKIADENNKRENTRYSKNYWLTKTLKCPICGSTYMGQTKSWAQKYVKKDGTTSTYSSTREYYMCRDMGKGKFRTCTNTKSLRKEFIESHIEDYIIMLKNKEYYSDAYNSAKGINFDNDIQKLKKEIKKLEKQSDSLTEKITFASVEVSKKLMNQMDKILLRKNELVVKKEELEYKNIETKNTKLNKDIAYQSICEFDKSLPTERKRILVMNIFDSIVYDSHTGKIKVAFH